MSFNVLADAKKTKPYSVHGELAKSTNSYLTNNRTKTSYLLEL